MAESTSFLTTLLQLRWLAALGQTLAILVAVHLLELPFVQAPLWVGVAVLVACNLFLHYRTGALIDRGAMRVVAHLGVDIAVLAWQVAHSGGLSNPFVSLFLLPIALAALVLPRRQLLVVTTLAVLGFAMAVAFAQPIADPHAQHRDMFALHLGGMVANFLLSVAVIVVFMDRLARQLREREHELAAVRERLIRDEGILALATHAASLAHELNTPLGTMTLILDDLGTETMLPAPVREDIAQLQLLTAQCRDRVHALAQPAHASALPSTLAATLSRALDHWRLLHPDIGCAPVVALGAAGEVPVDHALGALLRVLLDNASDASRAAGRERVAVSATVRDAVFECVIEDQGDGRLGRAPGHDALFSSSKPDGLGIGLALVRATIDRHGGSLTAEAAADVGSRVLLRWPLHDGGAS